MSHQILLIDDDDVYSARITRLLRSSGVHVHRTGTVRDGLALFVDHEMALTPFDVVVVLDGVDQLGAEAVEQRLQAISAVTVIRRYEMDDAADIAEACTMALGGVPELPVHLPQRIAEVLIDGDLEVQVEARRVRRGGLLLQLTRREFDLLVHLMRHRGRSLSRHELLRQVWRGDAATESNVTVHVARLRDKLGLDAARSPRVTTVYGRGYRWDAVS